MVSLSLSRRDTLIHMQLDLLRSPHDLERLNFDFDLSRSSYTYILRCALTRQTRCCQNYCSVFSNMEVIEKLFCSKISFLTFRDL